MLSPTAQAVTSPPKSFTAARPKLIRVRSLPSVRASCATAAPPSPTSPTAFTASSSLYDVLGISAGASGQEIKAAYRKLARSIHPDVAAAEKKSSSANEFIRLHSAYVTLLDPQKRADYDRRLVARRAAPLYYSPSRSSSSSPSSSSSYSRFTTSASPPPSPNFSRFARRSWETDQCW